MLRFKTIITFSFKGKNRFVVCYFTAYGHYTGFKVSDIDPSLCSHILFVYNELDNETLLLKPSDSKETIEGKIILTCCLELLFYV
jgi:hypothetical protein